MTAVAAPARDTFGIFGTTATLLVSDQAALAPARAIADFRRFVAKGRQND